MHKAVPHFVGLLIFLSSGLFAQTVINGNMEYWETQDANALVTVKENPIGWTTRNHTSENPLAVFCKQTSDSYSGARAAVLQNYSPGNGLSLSSFMSLGYFGEDEEVNSGVAFNLRPYSLNFVFKYFTLGINQGEFFHSKAVIEMTKWDDDSNSRISVGKGEYVITDKTNFYRNAQVVINYTSEIAPDSMRIFFTTSNDPEDEVELTIDDIHLKMETKVVGLDDRINVDEVTLFPNPVSDWLTFVNPLDVENAKVHVYNAVGQLVIDQPLTGTGGKIDCQLLQGGMYFYQIRRSDELLQSGKLMKI
ncbi:MAG: T9SS type A sorting domain-containing protein [Saprospiraceae bacterium]